MDFLIRDEAKLTGLLESILFAAGEPVSAADTADALGITRETLDSCADRLEESYRSSERGIRLVRTEDRYSLSTKPENYPQIAAVLGRSRRRTLTRASAEVLAVVAYRQPVTRVDVDQIRGVGSAGSIQKLLDSDLIEECGRLEAPGRPYLYRTTQTFLINAGIRSLEELPDWNSFGGNEESDDEPGEAGTAEKKENDLNSEQP